jgi:preprotein translocase subunit SecD
MRIRINGFNLYLTLSLAAALLVGCKTAHRKENKILSTLRLHLEARPDPLGRTESAKVYRERPVLFTIDKAPFLTEASVKSAKVIDVIGGFAIEIQFDRQGSWLLEQYTSANRTKHIIVASQFVEPDAEKINIGRFLAAPQINNHITDGRFVFTPDSTREEAERVALGLNHVAKKLATGKDVKM